MVERIGEARVHHADVERTFCLRPVFALQAFGSFDRTNLCRG